MDDHLKIDLGDRDLFLQLSRRAPAFLNAKGKPFAKDPVKETYDELRQAFSRLAGQRMLEVATAALMEMPENEKIVLEWEHDEASNFYLRFSNGWSLALWTGVNGLEKPCDGRFEHKNEAGAPAWFPRSEAGLNRWKVWMTLLINTGIDDEVDALARERLQEFSDQHTGLSRKDLPLIAQALVGEEWQSALNSIELQDGAPAIAGARKGRSRRI